MPNENQFSNKMKPNYSQSHILLLFVFMYFAGGFLGQLVSQLVLMNYFSSQADPNAEAPAWLIVLLTGITHAIMHLGVVFVFLRAIQSSFKNLIENTGFSLKYIFIALVITAPGIMITDYLAQFGFYLFEQANAYHIIEAEYARQQDVFSLFADSSTGLVLLSIAVFALLPAIGEELVFRGVLFSYLKLANLNPHFVVWFSALLFAGIHWQPINLIAMTCMGALLGYLRLYSGRLIYGMVFHFLFNATQIIILFYWPDLAQL